MNWFVIGAPATRNSCGQQYVEGEGRTAGWESGGGGRCAPDGGVTAELRPAASAETRAATSSSVAEATAAAEAPIAPVLTAP